MLTPEGMRIGLVILTIFLLALVWHHTELAARLDIAAHRLDRANKRLRSHGLPEA